MKRGWHKFTALFLSAMLIVGMIPLSAGATTPNGTGNQTSASQIVENGGTVTAHNGLVSASKTIQGTDTENVFDITLNVTTTEDIKQLDISPDAAVVLVMDVSNSMKEDVNGNSTRWDSERRITKAKAAAQDFLESYVKDAGDAKRMVSVVEFGSNVKKVSGWVNANAGNDRVSTAASSAVEKTEVNFRIGTDWWGFPVYDDGGTNIEGGLMMARNLLGDSAVSDIKNVYVVMLTDGVPTFHVDHDSLNTSYIEGSMGGGSRAEYDDYKDVPTIAAQIKESATLYTISYATSRETATVGGMKIKAWLSSFANQNFDATNNEQLVLSFENIAQIIQNAAKAWITTDPMGDHIVFDTDYNANENGFATNGSTSAVRSFDPQTNTVSWDLKNDATVQVTEEGGKKLYHYSLTYRIALDTTSGVKEGAAYPTNGTTTLSYMVTKDGAIDPTLYTVDYKVPSVMASFGSLSFKKTAEDGKTALPGAEFTLSGTATGSNKPWNQTAVADQNGNVSFDKIPAGTYTLSETKTPDGFVAMSDKTVVVLYGQTTVDGASAPAVIANTSAKTDISVEKVWQGGTEKAVTVKLLQNGNVYKTVQLSEDNNWQASFENVPLVDATGKAYTYTVEEINVEGYTSKVTGNADNGFVITNTRDTGSLKIEKTLAAGSENVTIPSDTTFNVYAADGTLYATFTYADMKDGVKTFENVPTGSYYVVESGAEVDSYTLTVTGANAGAKSEVTKDQTGTLHVENNYQKTMGDNVINPVSLTVQKVDGQTSDKLSGAVFTLSRDQIVVNTYTTGEDGTATITFNEAGTYTLTETTAPEGYVNSGVSYTITVSENGPVEVILGEDDLWHQIYNLIMGIDPTEDYEDGVLTVSNEKVEGTITVQKTVSLSDNGEATANGVFTFTVKDASGKVVDTLTVAADGSDTTGSLPYGTYTIEETGTATVDGYTYTGVTYDGQAVASYTVEVKEEGQNVTVNAVNTYTRDTGSLTVTKALAEGSENVTIPDGTTFQVYAADGTAYGDSFTYADMENGAYTLENVPTGNYYVIESNGNVASYTLTVTGADEDTLATVEKNETATLPVENLYEKVMGEDVINPVSLTVQKVDGETNEALSGAVFTLTRDGEEVGTYTTGEDGTVAITFSEGGTYTLTETAAPEGYVLGGESYTIEVTKSGLIDVVQNGDIWQNIYNWIMGIDPSENFQDGVLTVKNDKIEGTITIGKMVEFKDGMPEPMVNLEEDGNENEYVPSVEGNFTFTVKNTEGEVVDTLVVTDGGMDTTNSLPYGTYIIEETGLVDVEDYTHTKVTYNGENTDFYMVTIDENGEDVKVMAENTYTRDTGMLTITKALAEGSVDVDIPMTTTFTVYMEDGTEFATFTYADMVDGEITFYFVPTGRYYVVESGAEVPVCNLTVTGTGAENAVNVTKEENTTLAIENLYEMITVNVNYVYVDIDDNLVPEGAIVPEGDKDLLYGSSYTTENLKSANEVEGYVFNGWYLDEACTIPFEDIISLTEDTTLYGYWTAIRDEESSDVETSDDGSSDDENIDDGETPTGPADGGSDDVNSGNGGEEEIGDNNTPTGSADGNTPTTGDTTNLIVPMVTLALSGVLAFGVHLIRKKSSDQE